MNKRRLTRIAAVGLLAIFLSACGGGSSGGDLSGSVAVDGSSTVGPVTEAVAEEFAGDQPGVEASVGISGTGGGFEKFCAGEVDIVNASRPIDPDEEEACRERGVDPVELEVALDGIAVVANRDVTWTDCLTMEQLKKVWDEGSTVRRWSDLDPSFPDTDLALFGPGTDSGTFDFFTETVNGEEGRSRNDYTPSEDDNVLVRGVEGQAGALGYFGVAYYEQNKDRLKALDLDAGDGCVTSGTETVQDGSYPLSRPLYVYVAAAEAEREEVAAFVDFYLDNVNALVPEIGYVPLPDERLAASREAWAAATR